MEEKYEGDIIHQRRRMVCAVLNTKYGTDKIMFFIHAHFMPFVVDLLCGYTYECTPFVPPGVLKITVTFRPEKKDDEIVETALNEII